MEYVYYGICLLWNMSAVNTFIKSIYLCNIVMCCHGDTHVLSCWYDCVVMVIYVVMAMLWWCTCVVMVIYLCFHGDILVLSWWHTCVVMVIWLCCHGDLCCHVIWLCCHGDLCCHDYICCHGWYTCVVMVIWLCCHGYLCCHDDICCNGDMPVLSWWHTCVVMVSTVSTPSEILAGTASILIQNETQERITISMAGM